MFTFQCLFQFQKQPEVLWQQIGVAQTMCNKFEFSFSHSVDLNCNDTQKKTLQALFYRYTQCFTKFHRAFIQLRNSINMKPSNAKYFITNSCFTYNLDIVLMTNKCYQSMPTQSKLTLIIFNRALYTTNYTFKQVSISTTSDVTGQI